MLRNSCKIIRSFCSWVVLAILGFFLIFSCEKQTSIPRTTIQVNFNSLYSKAVSAIMESRYVDAVMYFEAVERHIHDLEPRAKAAYFIQRAQAEGMRNMGEAANKHIQMADSITQLYGLDSLRCLMYNAYGIISQNYDADKFAALDYYIQGINLAKKIEYDYMQAVLSANASWLFLLDDDMSGLVYAEDCYRYAEETENHYVMYCGALTAAQFYIKQGRIEEANEMLSVATESSKICSFADLTELYMAKGDLYAYQNNVKNAIAMYEKSVSYDSVAMPDYTFFAYTHWAEFMLKINNYPAAVDLAKRGLGFIEQNSLQIYRPNACAIIAKAYSFMGEHDSAMIYQSRSAIEQEALHKNDIRNVKRSIESKYEQEHKLFVKEVELRSVNERFIYIMCLSLLLLIALSVLYISRRRTVRLYKQLVAREVEWNRSKNSSSNNSQISVTPIKIKSENDVTPDSGERELFEKLDNLMRTEQLYKDPYLGRDKLAELLHTNRTYISKAINTMQGMSVSRYIALYRLNAASEVLSDKDNNDSIKDIAMELGFTSLSTFYSLFKERYKLSPDKFRKYAKENFSE